MKVSDKLAKVDMNYTINQYDNGYMVEVTGQGLKDEWTTARINCATVEELTALVVEISELPRD